MDQDTSPTVETNMEHNIPSSLSTAVGNMICVITQTAMAMILTDTEIPVYQQTFPSFSQYGLRNLYL